MLTPSSNPPLPIAPVSVATPTLPPGFDLQVERRVYLEAFRDCLKKTVPPAVSTQIDKLSNADLEAYLEKKAGDAHPAEMRPIISNMIATLGYLVIKDDDVAIRSWAETVDFSIGMADAIMLGGENGDRSDPAYSWPDLTTHRLFLLPVDNSVSE